MTNAQIVGNEKGKVTISFDCSAENFEESINKAFLKSRKNFNIPGFRKGKATRRIIEATYGESVFYQDAFNILLAEAYPAAIEELKLEPVSKPDVDVKKVDKNEGVTFEIRFFVKPEVKLGKYKEFGFVKPPMTIEEAEIHEAVNNELLKNARSVEITDRPCEKGDTVEINYLGTVDGVPFDGGQANDYHLVLGSKQFIPGFEEQVIGHSIGENFDITVTFPEDYHEEKMQGKEAVFNILLKRIARTELPKLTDEYVQDISEFDNVNDYVDDLQKKMIEEKEKSFRDEAEKAIIETIIENTEMEVPEIMYENRIDELMMDLERNLKAQGLSVETYCKYMGGTPESVRENFRQTAKQNVDSRLVLEEIAKVENITVSDEELDEYYKELSEKYNVPYERIVSSFDNIDIETVKSDLATRKALELVYNSSIK